MAWLESPWQPGFEEHAGWRRPDLLEAMSSVEPLTPGQLDVVGAFCRSAERAGCPIPGEHEISNDGITLLAAGFVRGEVGASAWPTARGADRPSSDSPGGSPGSQWRLILEAWEGSAPGHSR